MERTALLQSDEDEELVIQRDNGKENGKTYEQAISATGYGKFHYLLLALCGWAVSSDAVELLSISFILPPATCQLDLSTSDKGWINSSVFLGMMFGGYVWGTLADMRGRRSVLLWSLSVNALGGLLSSFAQVKWLFILMRFISGLGVGGSMPVIFTYFVEFQPKERRGAMISFLATFWMCGNILAAALAWIIIPRDIHLKSASGFHYDNWRVYLAVCIIPSFTSVLMFVLMPESPKYLIGKGREAQAIKVLQRIYSSNCRNPASDYPVTSLKLQEDDPEEKENKYEYSIVKNIKNRIIHFFKNTIQMFKAPLTSVSIVFTVIYFTLSFGYYGLFMWFPELFNKVEQAGGGSVCSTNDATNMTSHNSTIDTCETPSSVYFEQFLIAISNLPGNILTILVIDRIGRKIPLVLSMIISGASVFFIYLMDSRTGMLVLSCLFSGISVIGWNALDVLMPELYPTNLRSTASGVLLSIGRIASVLGNQVFGQLVYVNCAVPMLMVVVFLATGGLVAIKLPNMTKKDLL